MLCECARLCTQCAKGESKPEMLCVQSLFGKNGPPGGLKNGQLAAGNDSCLLHCPTLSFYLVLKLTILLLIYQLLVFINSKLKVMPVQAHITCHNYSV